MFSRLEQPLKIPLPEVPESVRDLVTVTDVSVVQPENASPPIVVSVAGKVMLSRLVQ